MRIPDSGNAKSVSLLSPFPPVQPQTHESTGGNGGNRDGRSAKCGCPTQATANLFLRYLRFLLFNPKPMNQQERVKEACQTSGGNPLFMNHANCRTDSFMSAALSKSGRAKKHIPAISLAPVGNPGCRKTEVPLPAASGQCRHDMVCVIIRTGHVERVPVLPPQGNFLLARGGCVQWPQRT